MTRVIVDARSEHGRAVARFATITDARAALAAAAVRGPILAELWREPDAARLDPFGLDLPTWQIIRTPEQHISTEMHPTTTEGSPT